MTQYTKPTVLPAWAESAGGADVLQPSNAEIQAGWPLSNVPPSRKRFNWVLKYLAQGVRYILQRGMPEWDAAEDYRINDRVMGSDGKTYKCIQAGINKDPTTQTAYWVRWGFTLAELDAEGTTPAQFDNTVKRASTAFVQRALGNFRSLTGIGANYSVLAADSGQILAATVANTTFTLPLLNSGPSGMSFGFHCNSSAGSVVIACSGADTIQYGSKSLSSITLKSGDSLILVTDGGSSWCPIAQSAGLGKQSVTAVRTTSVQSFPNNAWTRVQYNGKDFDPHSVFDAVTNFRFQPTLPGKYLICAAACSTSVSAPAAGSGLMVAVYKNGGQLKLVGPMRYGTNAYQGIEISTIVDANGSSDYFEIYAFHDSGLGNMNLTAGGETHFSAARIL